MVDSMLIEFRVGNHKSFRAEKSLSLVASSDDTLPENSTSCGKLNVLKAVGIYGPNASGKSNLIDALATMQQIILNPEMPGEKLPVTPFKLDEKYTRKPSLFEVIFSHKKIRYQYGFTATSERIHEEWLYAYPEGRKRDTAQTWFERKYNKKTKKTEWSKPSSFLKGQIENLKSQTTDNVLFLSRGAQLNNKQLSVIYEWFSIKLNTIQDRHFHRMLTISILKDEKLKKECGGIVKMIKQADFGLYGINIAEKEVGIKDFKFPPDMPKEVQDNILENMATEIEFIHKTKANKSIVFSPSEESAGTTRFFELAGPWLCAVDLGLILVVDELDASLHPHLVAELIKFIQNPKINTNGAQLIFSTHDTTLLNPELFRRDQIWFTEKDEHGQTNLYPMLDYKPRKDEAMQKGYLAGRYGATPMLEAFKLNG